MLGGVNWGTGHKGEDRDFEEAEIEAESFSLPQSTCLSTPPVQCLLGTGPAAEWSQRASMDGPGIEACGLAAPDLEALRDCLASAQEGREGGAEIC